MDEVYRPHEEKNPCYFILEYNIMLDERNGGK